MSLCLWQYWYLIALSLGSSHVACKLGGAWRQGKVLDGDNTKYMSCCNYLWTSVADNLADLHGTSEYGRHSTEVLFAARNQSQNTAVSGRFTSCHKMGNQAINNCCVYRGGTKASHAQMKMLCHHFYSHILCIQYYHIGAVIFKGESWGSH